MQIKTECMHQIIEEVNLLVGEIQKLPNWPEGRDKGYCTVIDAVDGRVILSFQVGNCPPEKVEKYYALSHEKAQRLRIHASAHGHVSSWQSQNEAENKFAGAISTGSLVFSFSGLPFGLADEAIMLLAARYCDCMVGLEAIRVARISGNNFFTDLDNLVR